MQTALLFSLLAGLSTALGGVLAALFPPSDRLLAASAGFAGGVMVTVSLAAGICRRWAWGRRSRCWR